MEWKGPNSLITPVELSRHLDLIEVLKHCAGEEYLDLLN